LAEAESAYDVADPYDYEALLKAGQIRDAALAKRDDLEDTWLELAEQLGDA
jgi:hypothetical protein